MTKGQATSFTLRQLITLAGYRWRDIRGAMRVRAGAFRAARAKQIATVGMTGGTGGGFPPLRDHMTTIPSFQTAKIQEGHIVVGHIFCALVETAVHDSTAAAPT